MSLFTNIVSYLNLTCLIVKLKLKLELCSFVKKMNINKHIFSQTLTIHK